MFDFWIGFAFACLLALVIFGLEVTLRHTKLEGRGSALLEWWGNPKVKEVGGFQPRPFLNVLTIMGAFLFIAAPLLLSVFVWFKVLIGTGLIISVGYPLFVAGAAVLTDRRLTHTGPTARYRDILKPVPATTETQKSQLVLGILCLVIGVIAVVYGVATGEEEPLWAIDKSIGALVLGFMLFAGFVPSLRGLRKLSEHSLFRKLGGHRWLLKPVWSSPEKRGRLTRALEDRRQHGIGG